MLPSPRSSTPPRLPFAELAKRESRKTIMPKADLKEQTAEPWFKDGLRFKCTACGDCCTGAPGYVWVNQAEITAMAERLGMEVAAFEKKYVRQIGVRRSLSRVQERRLRVFRRPDP